jgi:methylase of polypeptide subunit release factors
MTDALTPVVRVSETTFDGLRIRYDERVLTPRPWTELQSGWAVELLPGLPEGRVLELCCGAGHIGLAAVRRSRRRLVCVDRDPVAVEYAASNAHDAGMSDRVEVRQAALVGALEPDERFPLVIADPPWVARADTGRYPEDPIGAIDGGVGGLEVARRCLQVAAGHLIPGGAVLLQVGSRTQVADLRDEARTTGLMCTEVRMGLGGVIALFQPPAGSVPGA